MKYIYAAIFCVFQLMMFGQGTVNISYDEDIQALKQKFISENKSKETIKGWRIQIITTDDRRKMENAINKFSDLYPRVELKWNHVPPYYKVKVGAYETKMDAMPFLLELKKDFRGVIPVVEDIKKTELIRL